MKRRGFLSVIIGTPAAWCVAKLGLPAGEPFEDLVLRLHSLQEQAFEGWVNSMIEKTVIGRLPPRGRGYVSMAELHERDREFYAEDDKDRKRIQKMLPAGVTYAEDE